MKYELLCFDIDISRKSDSTFVIKITEDKEVLKDYYDKNFYVEYIIDMENCNVEYNYDTRYNINKLVKGLLKQIRKRIKNLCKKYTEYKSLGVEDKIKSLEYSIYSCIGDELSKFCSKLVKYLNIPYEILSQKKLHDESFYEKYSLFVDLYYDEIISCASGVISTLINYELCGEIEKELKKILYDEEIIGVFTFSKVIIFTEDRSYHPYEFIKNNNNEYSKIVYEYLKNKITENSVKLNPYDIYVISRKKYVTNIKNLISRALSSVIPINSELYKKLSSNIERIDLYNLILSSIIIELAVSYGYVYVERDCYGYSSLYSIFYKGFTDNTNLKSCVTEYPKVVDNYYYGIKSDYIGVYIDYKTLINLLNIINTVIKEHYGEDYVYSIWDLIEINTKYYDYYGSYDYESEEGFLEDIGQITIGRRIVYDYVTLYGIDIKKYFESLYNILNYIHNNNTIVFFEKPYGTFDTIMYLNYYAIKSILESYCHGVINLSDELLYVSMSNDNYTNIISRSLGDCLYMALNSCLKDTTIDPEFEYHIYNYCVFGILVPYQDTFKIINKELTLMNKTHESFKNYMDHTYKLEYVINNCILGYCEYCNSDILLSVAGNTQIEERLYATGFITCPYCSEYYISPLYVKNNEYDITPITSQITLYEIWNGEKVELFNYNYYKIGEYFPLIVPYYINSRLYCMSNKIDVSLLYSIYRLIFFRVLFSEKPCGAYSSLQYSFVPPGWYLSINDALHMLFGEYEYIKICDYDLKFGEFTIDKIKNIDNLYVEYKLNNENVANTKSLDEFLDEFLDKLYKHLESKNCYLFTNLNANIYIKDKYGILSDKKDVFIKISKQFVKMLIAYYIYDYGHAICEQFTINHESLYPTIIESITYVIKTNSGNTCKILIQNSPPIEIYGNLNGVINEKIDNITVYVKTQYGDFKIYINTPIEEYSLFELTLMNLKNLHAEMLSKLWGLLRTTYLITTPEFGSINNVTIECENEELLPIAYMFLLMINIL